jgi:hypothetical protein
MFTSQGILAASTLAGKDQRQDINLFNWTSAILSGMITLGK